MADNDIRASDAERDEVVAALAAAHVEGRLTQPELDERLARALVARTLGELAMLTRDLPAREPGSRRGVAPQPQASPAYSPDGRTEATGAGASRSCGIRRRGLRAAWLTWAVISGLCFVVWAVITLASGNPTYPWFLWVAGPWGIVLGLNTATYRRRPTEPEPFQKGWPSDRWC